MHDSKSSTDIHHPSDSSPNSFQISDAKKVSEVSTPQSPPITQFLQTDYFFSHREKSILIGFNKK